MFKVMLPRPVIHIERWKYSKLYGIYVSNLGNFRDKNKKPIKPLVGEDGYLTVKLKYGYTSAHRIVAATWLPQEDMLHLTVDHLDHNKRNNAVYNLEWVTKQENERRATEDLLISQSNAGKIIKMFEDETFTKEVLHFDTCESAAEWLKGNIGAMKNDNAMTIPKITERLGSVVKVSGSYCGYYWKFT